MVFTIDAPTYPEIAAGFRLPEFLDPWESRARTSVNLS